MLALTGACLAVGGALGAGLCICMERKRRIRQLLLLEETFGMVAGEISYSGIPLPEVLWDVGEKQAAFASPAADGRVNRSVLGDALCRAGSRMADGSGQSPAAVWQEEMEAYAAKAGLKGTEAKLLYSFPAAVCYCDGKRQQAAVLEFAGKMGAAAAEALQKEKENSRVTLAVSFACGALAAILLA